VTVHYQGRVASAVQYTLIVSLIMALRQLRSNSLSINSVFVSGREDVDVTAELERRALKTGNAIYELPYYTRVVAPFGKPERDDEIYAVKKEIIGDVQGYVHSYERVDRVERSIQGFGVYCVEQLERQYDFEDFVTNYIDCVVNLVPETDDGEVSLYEFSTIFDVSEYVPTESSTGFLYGVSTPYRESKKDRYVDLFRSFDDFRVDCSASIPGVIPHRAVIKPEVVGEEKKNRAIQVASPIYNIIGKRSILRPFEIVGNYFLGNYGGLPMSEGAIGRVFNDFKFKLKYFNYPAVSGYVEADKKEWEARADPFTARLFMLHHLGLIKHHFSQAETNGYLAFWRDYITPCIAIGGNKFLSRTGIVPSGSILTEKGNTFRHIYSRRLFLWFVRNHNYKSDDCVVCRAIGPWETSEKELLVDQYCVGICSDDFVGVRTLISKVCISFIEYKFGHKTEYVETQTPEFLRIRYVNGLVKRDTDRMKGKILYGTDEASSIMTGCVSLSYLCMNNRDMYGTLKKLYYRLRQLGFEPDPLRDSRLGLEDVNCMFPTYDQVMRFQLYTPKTFRYHQDCFTMGLVNRVVADFRKRIE